MVREGFTPRAWGTIAPSATNKFLIRTSRPCHRQLCPMPYRPSCIRRADAELSDRAISQPGENNGRPSVFAESSLCTARIAPKTGNERWMSPDQPPLPKCATVLCVLEFPASLLLFHSFLVDSRIHLIAPTGGSWNIRPMRSTPRMTDAFQPAEHLFDSLAFLCI